MLLPNLCACMGPMYGESSCYCAMISMGREKEMENNPARIAANQKAKEDFKGLERFFEACRKEKENAKHNVSD